MAAVEWQASVFCQNERGRIGACLQSIAAAFGQTKGLITVIVNGSSDGSATAARNAGEALPVPVQIFTIAEADKANAINAFIHDRRLRVPAHLYFFIDAYVTIAADALAATAARLAAQPEAVAATGIAGNGRTETRSQRDTVETGGVMHGQFYALTADFVNRMEAAGIRLPIGHYRGDGLLGSMAAHDLDAMGKPWANTRLIGVPEAVFNIEALSFFRWQDLRRQFRRKVRQMRGLLENAAVRQTIYAGGYTALPAFSDDMIRDYLATNPAPAVSLAERPFMALALRQHRAARRPAPDGLVPVRIA